MAQAMPAPFFILYAILHKMVDNLSGLMPPRTPHYISFFYCEVKERNMEKKENNALLHFSTEKCLFIILPGKRKRKAGRVGFLCELCELRNPGGDSWLG